MSLRYPVTIKRRAPGAWVAGRWVPGATGAPETIQATVQPAVLSDYNRMEPLLEGRRVEAMIRVYTVDVLAVGGQDAQASGDIVEWQGDDYEIVAKSPWQSNIIPHYRYLAARLVPAR